MTLLKEKEEIEEEAIISFQMDGTIIDLYADLSANVRGRGRTLYLATDEVYALIEAMTDAATYRAIIANREALRTYQNWYGVVDASAAYPRQFDATSDVDRFLAEATRSHPEGETLSTDLHRAYVAWSDAQGIRSAMPLTIFGRHINQRGYLSRRKSTNGVRQIYYCGLTLK